KQKTAFEIRTRISGIRAAGPALQAAKPPLTDPNRFAERIVQTITAVAGAPDGTQASIMSQFNDQFEHFQDDAPACDICGSICVRNGTCYRCFNCGNSMGCS
ncbi:MAG TPA: hypothetical protein PKW71_03925, partial [Anaerohalosphaeraceae bacterium]|nr:hypothetical protein [Anaerohalosphaeraceae bacterium]